MDPLQELYPFLHGQAKNPQREKAALLESVRQKSAESRNVKAQFFAVHAEALVSMAAALAAVYQSGGMLYTMVTAAPPVMRTTWRWSSCTPLPRAVRLWRRTVW